MSLRMICEGDEVGWGCEGIQDGVSGLGIRDLASGGRSRRGSESVSGLNASKPGIGWGCSDFLGEDWSTSQHSGAI
jgi:hypothetical protein